MASNKNINVASMLPTGTILHSNYRIDGYLSSGGFGNTYVATHVLFNETYAIKEFFMKDVSERGSDSGSVRVSNAGKAAEFSGQLEKFRKEALRLRKLHNEHIVRVYDLFNANGTSYYVMDYINGENLKERLQRTGQPMSEAEVSKVLDQVLDALQEVHGQGLWHMDLKPANVMMDQEGVVKLIDFGASKQFDADKGGAVSTSAVTYTNGYAPLEQMEKSYEKFGPWTDFYALGATLYNLLTLKHPPMPSYIAEDLTPDKHESLPLPAEVSPKLRELILWLLQTNSKLRPRNVQQIKDFINPPEPETKSDPEPSETKIDSKPKPEPEPAGEATKIDFKPKPESATVETQNLASPKPKSKNLKKIIWAACACLLLALGAYGLYHYIGSSDGTGNSTSLDGAEGSMLVLDAFGECQYYGSLNAKGMPDGQGVIMLANGDKLEGWFVNGDVDETHEVTYTYACGDVFRGTFKDNTFANGRFTQASDGAYFEGTFDKNMQSQGRWYDKNGKEISAVAD